MVPESEKCLNEIGIYRLADLQKIAAVNAYITLQQSSTTMKPSLHFLYAMVGAINNVSGLEVAKDRYRLLMELDGYEKLQQELNQS